MAYQPLNTSTRSASEEKLHDIYFNTDQSWQYQALWQLGEDRLRILIRRNAYDHQSYARVEVFSFALRKWEPLADLPYAKMSVTKAGRISYVNTSLTDNQKAYFLQDERELIRLAKLTLLPER